MSISLLQRLYEFGSRKPCEVLESRQDKPDYCSISTNMQLTECRLKEENPETIALIVAVMVLSLDCWKQEFWFTLLFSSLSRTNHS